MDPKELALKHFDKGVLALILAGLILVLVGHFSADTTSAVAGQIQQHLGAIVFNRMRRSPVPESPAWPEAKAAILAQEQRLFEEITNLIDSEVSQAKSQKMHAERLQETVAKRFGLRPQLARAFEETRGVEAIAAALASLGEAP